MIRRKTVWISVCALICCLIMAWVDGVLRPGYLPKSAIKLTLFLAVPLLISFLSGERSLRNAFRFQKRGFGIALGLGLGIYALILGGFFALRPFVDFSSIADSLSRNAGVTKENFLYVSLYISFINSLLEEFFFRGFVFLGLKPHSRGFAYGFSAALFALYHVAMMLGWFDFWLFALVLLGLSAGGLIFNALNEKQQTIYTSWLVHMFANFAINTIGFLLL